MNNNIDISSILLDKFNANTRYKFNETIFKEGDEQKGVYYIKNGKVKITRDSKNNQIAMWFAEPNEFVGLTSFFNAVNEYSFSSSAFGGDVDTIFISNKDFQDLLDSHPTFKQEIIKTLCDRISYTRKRISSVKSKNVRKRFLEAILLFTTKNDLKKSKIKIEYSIKELAELVGTSKQYIQKMLTEFQKNNLIELEKNALIILDLDKITKSVN